MKKTKENLLVFAVLICLSIFLVGCRNENTESYKLQDKEQNITQNDFIESDHTSRIGKEVLQYPGKTEEFKYLVYETYVEIDEYIGNASEVMVPEMLENLPVRVIGGFYFNETIKKVALPNTILVIDNRAFEDCFALEEINIPETVIRIGDCAFESCISLSSLTIPRNVAEIGDNAFGISHINASYKKIENFSAKVYKGSAAIKYIAEEAFDINYEIIDN